MLIMPAAAEIGHSVDVDSIITTSGLMMQLFKLPKLLAVIVSTWS